MKYTYEELAGMIDHSLLHPTMTDKELREGCEVAAKYEVASVCIKPYAVKEAAERLRGTGVTVGTVIGFPHGSSATEVKRYETEVACRDGATEIDMVINVGKALSGDLDYVERDVRAVVEEAHRHGAIVKVILENDFLPDGRDQDRAVPGLRAGGRRVREDLHRLRLREGQGREVLVRGRDRARPRADAGPHLAEGAGEGGRRRARPRRPDEGARPRDDALRGHRHRGDARRVPAAGGRGGRGRPRRRRPAARSAAEATEVPGPARPSTVMKKAVPCRHRTPESLEPVEDDTGSDSGGGGRDEDGREAGQRGALRTAQADDQRESREREPVAAGDPAGRARCAREVARDADDRREGPAGDVPDREERHEDAPAPAGSDRSRRRGARSSATPRSVSAPIPGDSAQAAALAPGPKAAAGVAIAAMSSAAATTRPPAASLNKGEPCQPRAR